MFDSPLQAEEERKLATRVSELSQDLTAERSRAAELQQSLQQSQENLSKLQSDFYGKDSEVSSLRQDLKVQKSPDANQVHSAQQKKDSF